MPLIRKILFWLSTAIYIVVCPLLILYAMGYIYKPVRQQFVQTGIIRLTTMPSGADVFLETSRYKKQTPTTISSILPGEYRIALRKKGYKPWNHILRVEAGKATAFEEILLIPDQWTTKELSQTEYEELIPLGDRHLFLLAESSNLGSFYVFEKNKELRPLLKAAVPFFELGVIKVNHTDKSDVLVVEGGSFWNRKYLYLNIKEVPSDANDITELFESKPAFIRWDAQNPMRLYVGGAGCINFIDMETREAYPCYLKDVKGFGINNENLYVLDANSVFWRTSADKEERQILSENMQLARSLFGQSDFYEIFAGDNGITLFLGTNGDLIAQRPPYHISSKGTLGFEFGPERNLLLHWSKKSIGLADFSSPTTKDIFKTAFTAESLYTKASSIRQCFWAYKDSHILYNDDDTLYLLERLPQGQPHVEIVAKIRKGTSVMYTPENGIIYYLEANSGKLEELRLIPSESLPLLGLKIQD